MDDLGDRMKAYEREWTDIRLPENLPVYARIDGHGFSRFTRGMIRPFDQDLHAAMVATTKHIVEKTHAACGYTQSDEISLVWNPAESGQETWFARKLQKNASVLSAMATAVFMRELSKSRLAQFADRLPHFDARIFPLPSLTEAANALVWRVLDCEKNAISMAAHHAFGHKSLQGVNGKDKVARLAANGIAFYDYPKVFTQGTWLRRVTVERCLTAEELDSIPEKHRPTADHTFIRGHVEESHIDFLKMSNREQVISNGTR